MPVIQEVALVLLAINAIAARQQEDFTKKNIDQRRIYEVTETAVGSFPPLLSQTDESDSFATESLDLVSGVYYEFTRPKVSPYGERMLQFNNFLERSRGLGKAIRKKNEKEAQTQKQAEKRERLAQKNYKALMKAPSKAVWAKTKNVHRGQRHR